MHNVHRERAKRDGKHRERGREREREEEIGEVRCMYIYIYIYVRQRGLSGASHTILTMRAWLSDSLRIMFSILVARGPAELMQCEFTNLQYDKVCDELHDVS